MYLLVQREKKTKNVFFTPHIQFKFLSSYTCLLYLKMIAMIYSFVQILSLGIYHANLGKNVAYTQNDENVIGNSSHVKPIQLCKCTLIWV